MSIEIVDVTGSGKGRDGFCDNCGSELTDGEYTCSWCGGEFCGLCIEPGRHVECTEKS